LEASTNSQSPAEELKGDLSAVNKVLITCLSLHFGPSGGKAGEHSSSKFSAQSEAGKNGTKKCYYPKYGFSDGTITPNARTFFHRFFILNVF